MTTSLQTRLGESPEEGIKEPCIASTVENITLSGELTLNTVPNKTLLKSGDRVLVRSQTDLKENGVYVVSATAWTRATDFNDSNDVINGQGIIDSSKYNPDENVIWFSRFEGEYSPDNTQIEFIRGNINVLSNLQIKSMYESNPYTIGRIDANNLAHAQALQDSTLINRIYRLDVKAGYVKVPSVDPSYPASSYFTTVDGAIFLLDETFIKPEMLGAVGDGIADDLTAFNGALIVASLQNKGILLCADVYRLSTTYNIDKAVSIFGFNKEVKVIVENSNTEEGFFITHSDVTLSNFTLSVLTSTGIINGSGDKGTNITISEGFVDPRLPEPALVKNIVIRDMTIMRENGSLIGHAISILARTSGVTIENIDFIGAGDTPATGMHADAILIHWGAHSHGVSTTQVSANFTGTFTEGETITSSGGATAYLVDQDIVGSTTTLYLKAVEGSFASGETINDPLGGSGTTTSASTTGLRQARFEPEHYSFHPNNIRIRNCRVRNTGRLIACSASYDVEVDNIDYYGRVNGGQLVDLPIGDEGGTFAHPDDYGRVYEGFSFRNIRARDITGTGANAVTVIDCSGFSTSKQTDADLAAYANAPYVNEAYAGTVHSRKRSFDWDNVTFDNFTFDAGPHDPPSVTPYIRTMYLRNLQGNFSFRNINAKGRDNVLSLELANCVGNMTFTDCKFLGGVTGNSTESTHFNECQITNPEIASGTEAVLWGGGVVDFTGSANAISEGDTTIEPLVPLSKRLLKGQRILFDGGLTTVASFHEAGDIIINVNPMPIALQASSSFSVDLRSHNVSFTNCTVSGGDEGYRVGDTTSLNIEGGFVQNTGQYGIVADDNSNISVTDVILSNNGLRRLSEPTLSTRDVIAAAGALISLDQCRFENSDNVEYNIRNSADSEKISVSNCIFAGTPAAARTAFLALSNGEPIHFTGNTTTDGVLIPFGGTWTPALTLGGDSVGLTYTTNEATFTVYDDRVMVDFDVLLTAKGTSTGQLDIGGLPFSQVGASIGNIMMAPATLDSNGSLILRAIGNELRVYEQSETTSPSVQHDNLLDNTRLIGSMCYRRL